MIKKNSHETNEDQTAAAHGHPGPTGLRTESEKEDDERKAEEAAQPGADRRNSADAGSPRRRKKYQLDPNYFFDRAAQKEKAAEKLLDQINGLRRAVELI